jgi:dUTP pyrophosphatase
MVTVKFSTCHERAVTPYKLYEDDACFDLVACWGRYDGSVIEYGVGLKLEIPRGYVGLIYPRSSIGDRRLVLANSVGVIDSGYRGEILVRFRRVGDFACSPYNVGDRIAQLMVVPIPKVKFKRVDRLSPSSRGAKGFGSTGS